MIASVAGVAIVLRIPWVFWPDPRALLILQSLVLAGGAWPAYQIARRHLQGRWFALPFVFVYLLSPSLIGANLSDFHPVTLCAAFFVWMFDAYERRAYRVFFLMALLILFSKEQLGLLVSMFGIYQAALAARAHTRAALRDLWADQQIRAGLLVVLCAAGWTALTIIIQRNASGQEFSLFAARYAWLGSSPSNVLQNMVTTPLLLDWLRQPFLPAYAGVLLWQSGFLALFAPEVLLLALPEILINTLSRFEPMHSPVAHYAAVYVPFLLLAAIIGVERTSRWLGQQSLPGRLLPVILGIFVLLASGGQLVGAGLAPTVQNPGGRRPYTVSAHAQRLEQLVARIPPGAKVSAQAELYPHLSSRADMYLFPTVSDADYILLDLTGPTFPIESDDYRERVQRLLQQSSIVVADDGYLLLSTAEGRDLTATHTHPRYAVINVYLR